MRETDRWTVRQVARHADRSTERARTERERDRETERDRQTETERERDAGRHTN